MYLCWRKKGFQCPHLGRPPTQLIWPTTALLEPYLLFSRADVNFGVPSLVFDGRWKFWSPISCFRWQMKMGKINTRAALWPPPNQPPFVFDPETKHGRRQIPGGSRFRSFAAAVSAAATKIDSVSSELSKNPTTPNLLSWEANQSSGNNTKDFWPCKCPQL